jgi:hypothetical protein
MKVGADKPMLAAVTQPWTDTHQPPGEIVWNRVYTLPDFVRFAHRPHVLAGIACQECHGPVQEMDRVYQYSSLKMGWCVTCHRQNLDHPTFPASMDCLVCHH